MWQPFAYFVADFWQQKKKKIMSAILKNMPEADGKTIGQGLAAV